MNNKHKSTPARIFEKPERSDIPWKDIEALIIAPGGEITEGQGSRVRIFLNGTRAVFHRPHPRRVTMRGAVKSVRRFLQEAEVDNDEV
ncbi:MAG: type II toxin-antitoxin system HicA family toxin [Candidatus Fermentibacteraceae bacterium]|nr:type II toxin-antitoxin system HicA family toxin [Candidatus Fermentibacteraceae bacterium]